MRRRNREDEKGSGRGVGVEGGRERDRG